MQSEKYNFFTALAIFNEPMFYSNDSISYLLGGKSLVLLVTMLKSFDSFSLSPEPSLLLPSNLYAISVMFRDLPGHEGDRTLLYGRSD